MEDECGRQVEVGDHDHAPWYGTEGLNGRSVTVNKGAITNPLQAAPRIVLLAFLILGATCGAGMLEHTDQDNLHSCQPIFVDPHRSV